MLKSALNHAKLFSFSSGCEGRAGMAAIVDENDSIDVSQLALSLHRSLPAYAKPMFLRFIKEADTTGMFTRNWKINNNKNNKSPVIAPLIYLSCYKELHTNHTIVKRLGLLVVLLFLFFFVGGGC